jgi:capsid protein
MDIKLIEADQVTSALGLTFDEREVDGIVFDNFGNPQSYRVMKNHPGGINFTYTDDFIDVPASAMIHNFRKDRPGLHRGVPEMTPALGLFAQLRRFSQATLNAAEAAADFAGILYTDAPPDGEADEVRPLDSFQLEKNMLLAMPGGWKMGQLDPKHPASTYAEYVDKIIDEIVRCILMPSNLGRGNSDKSSFASGRLDIQSYLRMLRVDQSFIATVIMDKILGEWLREYSLLNPSFGLTARYPLPQHFWFWDASHYHIDAYKEARAQEISLKTHATTLAAVYANQGKDWAGEILQRSREKQLMRKLGLTDEDVTPLQNNHDEKEEDLDMGDDE